MRGCTHLGSAGAQNSPLTTMDSDSGAIIGTVTRPLANAPAGWWAAMNGTVRMDRRYQTVAVDDPSVIPVQWGGLSGWPDTAQLSLTEITLSLEF